MRRHLVQSVMLAFCMVILIANVSGAPVARPIEGKVAAALRQGIASGRQDLNHDIWDELLRKHVASNGRVDYVGIVRARPQLDEYLKSVADAKLVTLSRESLLALFINAYNACTIRTILEGARDGALPQTIRDLPDPWIRKSCVVGGFKLSLDDIEHRILRPFFKDARIHFAVNCAARGCPELAPWAFRGKEVETQLAARTKAVVNSESHVRVSKGRLLVSRVFDWYKQDFVDDEHNESAASIPKFLLRYAAPELREKLEAVKADSQLLYLDYDWSLNDR